MTRRFDPYAFDYRSLSVADLLEAREMYHVHLAHLENVVATAVGLFRIREGDPDWSHPNIAEAVKIRGRAKARTFANSRVKKWSWPCVLVLVKRWIDPQELEDEPAHYGDQIVPPFLYLPDGRIIPTCALLAEPSNAPQEEFVSVIPPGPVLASGQPVVTTVQGQEHIGTVTCICFDGEKYFAMTNQHVAGSPGTEVRAWLGNQEVPIGATSSLSIRRKAFEQVYPGLPGQFTMSALDVGLIEIDNLRRWSSNQHGLGPQGGSVKLGPLVEFRTDTATLDWIGARVIGYGAASGVMRAEIKALFYRYRNVGGTDYTTDFLVGEIDANDKERKEGVHAADFRTQPGDSGALWCIDPVQLKPSPAPKRKGEHKVEPGPVLYRPFAVQWGGQKLSDGSSAYMPFGLASSLAVACRELGVEVVTDWNTDHTEYWGAVGHYKIAQQAVSLLKEPLRSFMDRHLDLLTFPNISAKPDTGDPETDFIPLADVPDLVWKTNINKAKGADGNFHAGKGSRPQENPNHYADIDLLDEHGNALVDASGVDAAKWLSFYEAAPVPANGLEIAREQASKKGQPEPPDHGIGDKHKGLLPFRVCQIFHQLVQFSRNGDAKSFLCAAGLLAHYVGDACQPLHGSRHADGLDGDATGVHSSYEEVMVDAKASQLAGEISGQIDNVADPGAISDDSSAASELLSLMKHAQGILPPEDICNVFSKYREDNGLKPRGGALKSSADTLWQHFGTKTAKCIALGIKWLAAYWQSAFDLGNPPAAPFHETFDGQNDLFPLYMEPDFLPSYELRNWITEFWDKGLCSGGASNGNNPGPNPQGYGGAKKKKKKPAPKGHKKTKK